MSDERRRILQMIQEGTLSAAEAMELLDALNEAGDSEEEETAVASHYSQPLEGEIIPSNPPNMDRYRHFWKIPFIIAFAFLLLTGLWLRSIYQSSEGAITFGFICVWSFFMLAFVVTLLSLFSRRAAWLHVRVKEKDGKRIAISMPLPLGLASWGIKIARGFVDEATRVHLEMASEFIGAAKEELKRPDAQPLMIDVDDDDGDQVQVFIG